jgi:peptide deformylase
MTIRPIICLPDPRLREVSKAVDAVDDGVRRLMDDMLETMYDAPGIGLAAIQIGIPMRLVVVDVTGRKEREGEAAPEPMEKPLFLVNPEIVWTSEELGIHEEGCLSIPEYYEEVERPAGCCVRYLDREGREQELACEGILATCIQHEVDHTNGVLFIDHISRLKRERVVRKFTKAAREKARGDA